MSYQKMEEDLTCPVCLELYADPLMMPCSHSICKVCLLDVMKSRAKVEKYDLECPSCRKSHLLKPEQIDKLPKNLVLENIVFRYQEIRSNSMSRESQKQSGNHATSEKDESKDGDNGAVSVTDDGSLSNSGHHNCGMCEDQQKKTAEWFCMQCRVHYCHGCLDSYHPKRGSLRQHKLCKSGHAPVIPGPELHCNDHPCEGAHIFCDSCKVVACHLCVCQGQGAHCGHVILDSVTAKEQLQKSVEKAESDLVDMMSTFQLEENNLESQIAKIKDVQATMKTQLNNQCTVLLSDFASHVHQVKLKSLQVLDDTVNRSLKELSTRMQHVQTLMNQCHNLKEACSSLMEDNRNTTATKARPQSLSTPVSNSSKLDSKLQRSRSRSSPFPSDGSRHDSSFSSLDRTNDSDFFADYSVFATKDEKSGKRPGIEDEDQAKRGKDGSQDGSDERKRPGSRQDNLTQAFRSSTPTKPGVAFVHERESSLPAYINLQGQDYHKRLSSPVSETGSSSVFGETDRDKVKNNSKTRRYSAEIVDGGLKVYNPDSPRSQNLCEKGKQIAPSGKDLQKAVNKKESPPNLNHNTGKRDSASDTQSQSPKPLDKLKESQPSPRETEHSTRTNLNHQNGHSLKQNEHSPKIDEKTKKSFTNAERKCAHTPPTKTSVSLSPQEREKSSKDFVILNDSHGTMLSTGVSLLQRAEELGSILEQVAIYCKDNSFEAYRKAYETVPAVDWTKVSQSSLSDFQTRVLSMIHELTGNTPDNFSVITPSVRSAVSPATVGQSSTRPIQSRTLITWGFNSTTFTADPVEDRVQWSMTINKNSSHIGDLRTGYLFGVGISTKAVSSKEQVGMNPFSCGVICSDGNISFCEGGTVSPIAAFTQLPITVTLSTYHIDTGVVLVYSVKQSDSLCPIMGQRHCCYEACSGDAVQESSRKAKEPQLVHPVFTVSQRVKLQFPLMSDI